MKRLENILNNNIRSIATILFAVLCMTACQYDINHPDSPENSQIITVRFQVYTPEPVTTRAQTRVQTPAECHISEIQVLVFENNLFAYRATGSVVETNGEKVTFDVPLNATNKYVKLYIVANANSIFATLNIPVGSSESDVKKIITMETPATGISGDLPMSGEYNLPGGLSPNNMSSIKEVKMLRSVARVDVIRAETAANFEIKSVQVYNAASKIQVIPTVLLNPQIPVVSTPSVPDLSHNNIITNQISVSNNTLTSQIYLPEASATDNNDGIRLVIGGIYGNSGVITYYRVDLRTGENVGEVLRNYQYVFRIDKVIGEGESSAEQAASKPAKNIDTTIESWEEEQINMMTDGHNFFSFSAREVTTSYEPNSVAWIDVSTNLPSYTIQWADAEGNPSGGESTSAIESNSFRVEIVAQENNASRIIVTAKNDNKAGNVHTEYILINAGIWTVHIRINQANSDEKAQAGVYILSGGTSYGSFGSNLPGRTSTGNADGFRELLLNKENFGPQGTVPVGFIGMDYMTGTGDAGNYPRMLEMFDIINIGYGHNPNAASSQAIVDWLNASPHRVLFICHDNTGTANNLFNLLFPDADMIDGRSYGSTYYNFTGYNVENDYFTQSGPFGAVNSTKDSFNFRPRSNTWLGFHPDSSQNFGLIPLLYSSNSNEHILAVDLTRRIVYIAHSRIYQDYSDGISGGNVTDDKSVLIANLWAWAIEKIVLPGKIKIQ